MKRKYCIRKELHFQKQSLETHCSEYQTFAHFKALSRPSFKIACVLKVFYLN